MNRWIRKHSLVALCAGACMASSASAATIVVDSTADDLDQGPNGNCTLREAVVAANENVAVDACPAGDPSPAVDVIGVPAGSYELSIAATSADARSGDLELSDDVRIQGAGAASTVVDATPLTEIELHYRVFEIGAGAQVTLAGLTMQGGFQGLDSGGGIKVAGGASLVLEECTVRDNQANVAGGIHVGPNATLDVRRSTIEGNVGYLRGGGVMTASGAVATLIDSTVSGNRAYIVGGQDGGSILLEGGEVRLDHVTIVDPQGGAQASAVHARAATVTLRNSLVDGDCVFEAGATAVSFGGNLESPGDSCGLTQASDQVHVASAGLGALAMNGGGTATHALQASSAAVDAALAGAACGAPEDQTGFPRPYGARCDVGAYEYRPAGGCAASVSGGGTPSALLPVLVPAAAIAVLRRRRLAS